MARTALNFSKGEVRRAGELLRRLPTVFDGVSSEQETFEITDRINHAFSVAENWRACHSYALQKGTMGLRSRVETAGAPLRVSQRHKRMATIIDKLTREPGMRLDRMQDIAGCRAVVDTISQVRSVERRYRVRPPPEGVRRITDYIDDPKPSGYRGVHVIIQHDDRLVEVQLRTIVQHHWAVSVERLGGLIGEDLKSGRGPVEVVSFLEIVAEAMTIEEVGGLVDDVLLAEIDRRRVAASPYFRGGERR